MKSYKQLIENEKYRPSTNKGIKWEENAYYSTIFDNYDFYDGPLDLTLAFGLQNEDNNFKRSPSGDFFSAVHNTDGLVFYKNGLKSYRDAQAEIEKHYLALGKIKTVQELASWASKAGFRKE